MCCDQNFISKIFLLIGIFEFCFIILLTSGFWRLENDQSHKHTQLIQVECAVYDKTWRSSYENNQANQ